MPHSLNNATDIIQQQQLESQRSNYLSVKSNASSRNIRPLISKSSVNLAENQNHIYAQKQLRISIQSGPFSSISSKRKLSQQSEESSNKIITNSSARVSNNILVSELKSPKKLGSTSVSPSKKSKLSGIGGRLAIEAIKEFEVHEEIDDINSSIYKNSKASKRSRSNSRGGQRSHISSRNGNRLSMAQTEGDISKPAGLVALFRMKNQPSTTSVLDGRSQGNAQNQDYTQEMDQEHQDEVRPLLKPSTSNLILNKFQSLYQKLNPSKSVDSTTVKKALNKLVKGVKARRTAFQQRGSGSGVGIASPIFSQKTNNRQDSANDSVDSQSLIPLRITNSVHNEILVQARVLGVETLNVNQSEDDEMYQDSQLFYDPLSQIGGSMAGSAGITSSVKRQVSEYKHVLNTPKKGQLQHLIANSEVMTNQIFEKVFLNDLAGLKKINEGGITYFDRKKKFNLRDLYRRTALFYSLIHDDSYDMVEFLVTNGCDTLFLDFKGRTPLHYACILGCDKKIIKFLIDYSKELDKFRAHTKEAMQEFKDRPIKNFDITPTNQDIMKQMDSDKTGMQFGASAEQSKSNGQGLLGGIMNLGEKTRKKANNCVSLKEYHEMGKQTSKLRDYFQNKVDKELLRQQRATQILTKEQEELFKRLKFEKKYKKSEEYIEALIQYINLVDNKGMTALHYAVRSGNIEIIKTLVQNGANLMIRDYKLRQPADCNVKKLEEVTLLLKNERMEFEEEFHNLKKSKNRKDVQKAINMFIDNPSRLTTMKFLSKRRLVIDQKNLSSKNNQQLEAFMYGIYQDNVLTYLMRINDMETFDYILRREVSPLATNENDMNSLHFSIQLEKISFLSYLFEGDFFQYEKDGLSEEIIEKKHQRLVHILNETDRYKKKTWIVQALIGLDRCSLNEGYTPLILALRSEKESIAQYIIQIALVRERLRLNEQVDKEIRSSFTRLEDLISYFDKKQKTSLLTAAKHGHLNSFMNLFKMGANFYASCSKLNNALHYAIMSESEQLIKFVSWSDAENSSGYGCMHNQKNIKGMLPIDYDRKKRFYDIVNHIWDSVTLLKNPSALERVQTLLKNNNYTINQQTTQGLNTPLHFAVMYENIKAIALLLKQPGVSMNIKNREGKIPIDYAHLIANKTTQFQICNSLQKALSVHYKSSIHSPPSDSNLPNFSSQGPNQQEQNNIQSRFKPFLAATNSQEDKIKLYLPAGYSSPPKKLKASNHQKTIMPSHQFTITEHGHLYTNKAVQENQHKSKKIQFQDASLGFSNNKITEISDDDSSILIEDPPKFETCESMISIQELSEQNTLNSRTNLDKIQLPESQNVNLLNLNFGIQVKKQEGYLQVDSSNQNSQNTSNQTPISPININPLTSSKLLDARDILKQKLAEYREYARNPQLLIGKFPVDIFKRWYDQYNQQYSNRETEKLQHLFEEIFSTLKDQHEKNIKIQIALYNQFTHQVKEGERYRNSDGNNAYYHSKKQFNGENYLTFRQIEPFIDQIIERMEMSKLEGGLFKEFMPIYYEDTKISITEFCHLMMNKFKIFKQTKQKF